MPKLTLNISHEMDEAIEALAAEQGVPKAQIVRRAVLLLRYLDTPERDVEVTEKATGEKRNLLFESQL